MGLFNSESKQTKTTLGGWTAPYVGTGVLKVATQYPRSILIVDTVNGTVTRGARYEHAVRTNLRVQDIQGLLAVAQKVAKANGVALEAPKEVLPTSFSIPGNGPVDIDEMSEAELLMAIYIAKGNGSDSKTVKALEAALAEL